MPADLLLLWGYMPRLLQGVAITAEVCVIAITSGMMLGFVVALLRRIRFPPVRWLVVGYVEVLRGTPLLIQLVIIYTGLPQIGIAPEIEHHSEFLARHAALRDPPQPRGGLRRFVADHQRGRRSLSHRIERRDRADR